MWREEGKEGGRGGLKGVFWECAKGVLKVFQWCLFKMVFKGCLGGVCCV